MPIILTIVMFAESILSGKMNCLGQCTEFVRSRARDPNTCRKLSKQRAVSRNSDFEERII